MKIIHYMKPEPSGLFFQTMELAAAEERLGHTVCVRAPNGNIVAGRDDGDWDVELIHHQLPLSSYHNDKRRFMWMHGEPISSVGNKISMKAIIDLAPLCDAFIAMRREEMDYWSLIKRTHLVTKGIDLSKFCPLPLTEAGPKLSGSPAVLYYENWRGNRNPLPLVAAMAKVWREYPDARLHLYNCGDKKLQETFRELSREAKLFPFLRSLQGPVLPNQVNQLLNRADIVVSCLYPFYARSIEALGAGKGFLCPGYEDPEYPFHCTLDPDNMAKAIINLWENGCGKFDFRGWAEKKHDVNETVRQSVRIYERYLDSPQSKEPTNGRIRQERSSTPTSGSTNGDRSHPRQDCRDEAALPIQDAPSPQSENGSPASGAGEGSRGSPESSRERIQVLSSRGVTISKDLLEAAEVV